jgi:hypothetical protein
MQDNKFSPEEMQRPDGAPKEACVNHPPPGSLPGHALQHWLEAEAQLLAERNLRAASSVSEPETKQNSQLLFHERADISRENQLLKNPIVVRDLTREAPHSPRERLAGFAIAIRAVDKCLASLAGVPGEYHYDSPLDNKLFSFKSITGDQFKTAVQAATNYADVGAWLQANGSSKTPAEIKAWSDEVEAGSMMRNPEKRACFMENCSKLGLNPETTSTFDWLEADDRASFSRKAS